MDVITVYQLLLAVSSVMYAIILVLAVREIDRLRFDALLREGRTQNHKYSEGLDRKFNLDQEDWTKPEEDEYFLLERETPNGFHVMHDPDTKSPYLTKDFRFAEALRDTCGSDEAMVRLRKVRVHITLVR